MRVLQVIDSLAPGGAETIVCHLSESLRQIGITSDIFSLTRTGSWLERNCESRNIRVSYSCAGSLHSPLQASELARSMRTGSYDLVHVHLFPAQLWAAMAAAMTGRVAPMVTTEHSTLNRRRSSFFRPIDIWMYGKYAALIGVSHAAANALALWTGRRNVETVHNGVPLDRIDASEPCDIKRELGLSGEFLAVSVGRYETVKNHECSIRAMARTKDIHLAIAGDGTLRERYRSLAESLGVAPRLHLLGQRADAIGILKGADVYIQSSAWEGFGLAAVEAMATGLPVIAAAVAGLRDIVRGAGITFEPDDDAELAAHLAHVAASAEMRARLAVASRKRSLEFGISETARRYADLYRAVALRTGPACQN